MNTNIKRLVIGKYMEFPNDTDPEQARQVFERRFGYRPEIAEVIGPWLLVGPVKEE